MKTFVWRPIVRKTKVFRLCSFVVLCRHWLAPSFAAYSVCLAACQTEQSSVGLCVAACDTEYLLRAWDHFWVPAQGIGMDIEKETKSIGSIYNYFILFLDSGWLILVLLNGRAWQVPWQEENLGSRTLQRKLSTSAPRVSVKTTGGTLQTSHFQCLRCTIFIYFPQSWQRHHCILGSC